MDEPAIVVDRLLRLRLSSLDSGPLQGDVDLRAHGLDSMGAVQLMLDLETELGIVFPDDAVTPETFETRAGLLEAVRRAISDPRA